MSAARWKADQLRSEEWAPGAGMIMTGKGSLERLDTFTPRNKNGKILLYSKTTRSVPVGGLLSELGAKTLCYLAEVLPPAVESPLAEHGPSVAIQILWQAISCPAVIFSTKPCLRGCACLAHTDFRYSATCSPDPPNCAGKSVNFGRPSRMGSTVSA